MEYIEGVTLDEHLKPGTQLPVKEAVKIAIDILDILSFAHKKGISHRDIKPSNVMLEKSGKVKIIDFGIAKGESDPNLTAAGTSCGTPTYMAPEQFTPTEKTNYYLVDIYAVGTTLYRFLTGDNPFNGVNEFAIRDAKLFNEPPSPRKLNNQISKQLEKIILKSLARDPKERFSSADEMIEALKQIIDITPKPSMQSDMTIDLATGESRKSSRKNKKPLFIGLALAVVVILAIAGWKFLSSPSTGASENVENTTAANIAPEKLLPGIIDINVDPAADSIFFNDSLIATNSGYVSVERQPGRYPIRIVKGKGVNSPIIDSVEIPTDAITTSNYTFEMPVVKPVENIIPKPKISYGKIRVGSIPNGASVYINSVLQDHKTVFTFDVKTGEYLVEIKFGEMIHTERVIVKENELLVVSKDFTN
jgi:serine/threonine protein kinase